MLSLILLCQIHLTEAEMLPCVHLPSISPVIDPAAVTISQGISLQELAGRCPGANKRLGFSGVSLLSGSARGNSIPCNCSAGLLFTMVVKV